MITIQVFDPPMCCPTGICGPSVDPKLVRFASDLQWLVSHEVRVERYNLSQQPRAFAANDSVKAALQADGNSCLPLVLLNGEIATRGAYPSRRKLAELSGLTEQLAAEEAAPKPMSLPVMQG